MFAKNEPNALKNKPNEIERSIKLGKLNLEVGNRQKVSINQQKKMCFILPIKSLRIIFNLCIYNCVIILFKFEVLTALKHLGCELTDSNKIFLQEETSKLQSSSLSNSFNIPDSLDGLGIYYFS